MITTLKSSLTDEVLKYFSEESLRKMLIWFQTCALFWMLNAFFWVMPRHLNFICQRFETLCLFHFHTYQPMKMEQSVPKRWHIKFRSRGTTQKKACKILTPWYFCTFAIQT